MTKATLEGLFADELALLQPTPGYMRLLKESVLQIWKARKAAVHEEIATAERAARAIQEKRDRLDDAFLFDRTIDIDTYDRHAEKLREELTLARIDRHSGQLEQLDVEGILAFAERILPRAADLWACGESEPRMKVWWTRTSPVGTNCRAGCEKSQHSGRQHSRVARGGRRRRKRPRPHDVGIGC